MFADGLKMKPFKHGRKTMENTCPSFCRTKRLVKRDPRPQGHRARGCQGGGGCDMNLWISDICGF